MKKSIKKTVLNLTIVLLISVGCTFYFAGFSLNIVDVLLNILYGVTIGVTIAFGSAIITRVIYKREDVYENPTRYLVLAILLVAGYIIVSVVLVNYLWFYFTQGTSFIDLFSHRYAMYALTSEFILGLLLSLIHI